MVVGTVARPLPIQNRARENRILASVGGCWILPVLPRWNQFYTKNEMDVLEIKSQSLSLVLADFHVCEYCHIVDRDQNRIRYEYPCPTCGKPGNGGHMYFDLSVDTLINLMQESFHATPWEASENTTAGISSRSAHYLSVVILFCTLREMLLSRFVYELLVAQKIPARVCRRLLADNSVYKQRQGKLFRCLTGEKWKNAIRKLSMDGNLDYVELDEFLKQAVDARNKFLHEGSKWAIDKAMAEGCMRNIWPLLNLFVDLHNHYVYPLYSRDAEDDS